MKFDLPLFNVSIKSGRIRRVANSQRSNVRTVENHSFLLEFRAVCFTLILQSILVWR